MRHLCFDSAALAFRFILYLISRQHHLITAVGCAVRTTFLSVNRDLAHCTAHQATTLGSSLRWSDGWGANSLMTWAAGCEH
ncbi:hypothetical protein ACO0LF_00010 [Undibacterium sp. Di27W]